jgi:archaellum component FlaC
LSNFYSEKFLKKLIGGTDIEDALRSLDNLTQEESWMAAAELRKMMHVVDGRVMRVDEGVQGVRRDMEGVSTKVQDVRDTVQGVDVGIRSIGHKVEDVSSTVQGVDDKVEQINRSSPSKYYFSCFSTLTHPFREPAER